MIDEILEHCLQTLRMLTADDALKYSERKHKEFPRKLREELKQVSVDLQAHSVEFGRVKECPQYLL